MHSGHEGCGVLGNVDIHKALKERHAAQVPGCRMLGACSLRWCTRRCRREQDDGGVSVGFVTPQTRVQLTAIAGFAVVALLLGSGCNGCGKALAGRG